MFRIKTLSWRPELNGVSSSTSPITVIKGIGMRQYKMGLYKFVRKN